MSNQVGRKARRLNAALHVMWLHFKEIAGKASVDVGDRFAALLGASLNADDSNARMNARMPTFDESPPNVYQRLFSLWTPPSTLSSCLRYRMKRELGGTM
jgi:hypothetical protein